MEWHVQYRSAGAEHVAWHPTPEAAIEAVWRMMDDGIDVFGIGEGSMDNSIGRDQVARIYAIWQRGKRPSAGHRQDRHGFDQKIPISLQTPTSLNRLVPSGFSARCGKAFVKM
jgi:hypothetical protein